MPRARHVVLAVRRRAEGRRHRGRPQDPRRPRGARPGSVRRARHAPRARRSRPLDRRPGPASRTRSSGCGRSSASAARAQRRATPSCSKVRACIDGALDRGRAPRGDLPRQRRDAGVRAARASGPGHRRSVAELKEGVLEKVGTTRTPQPVLAVATHRRRQVATRRICATRRDARGHGRRRRSREPRHDHPQRRGVGRRRRRACRALGRPAQPEGRAVERRRDVRRAGRGARRPGGDESTTCRRGRRRLGTRAHGGDALRRGRSRRRAVRWSSATRPTASTASSTAHLDGTVTIPMAGPPSRSTSPWRRRSCASRRPASAAPVAAAHEPRRAARASSTPRLAQARTDGCRRRRRRERARGAHREPRASARPRRPSNEAIKAFAPDERPAAGQAVGAFRAAIEALWRRPPGRARGAPAGATATRST